MPTTISIKSHHRPFRPYQSKCSVLQQCIEPHRRWIWKKSLKRQRIYLFSFPAFLRLRILAPPRFPPCLP